MKPSLEAYGSSLFSVSAYETPGSLGALVVSFVPKGKVKRFIEEFIFCSPLACLYNNLILALLFYLA